MSEWSDCDFTPRPSASRKVLITGSRTYGKVSKIKEMLFSLPFDAIIVHGACPDGADAIADLLARSMGLEVRAYPVNNALDGYDEQCPKRRNSRMLEAELEGLTDCWAFKDKEQSPGTNDMVEKCIYSGVPLDGDLHGDD